MDGEVENDIKVRTVGQGVSSVPLGVGKRDANTGDMFVTWGRGVEGLGCNHKKEN